MINSTGSLNVFPEKELSNQEFDKLVKESRDRFWSYVENHRQGYRDGSSHIEYYMFDGEKRERVYLDPIKRPGYKNKPGKKLMMAYDPPNRNWIRLENRPTKASREGLKHIGMATIKQTYVTFNNEWVNYHYIAVMNGTGREIKFV